MNVKEEKSMNSIERVATILDLKEPDRVPTWVLMDWLPAKYYDITIVFYTHYWIGGTSFSKLR